MALLIVGEEKDHHEKGISFLKNDNVILLINISVTEQFNLTRVLSNLAGSITNDPKVAEASGHFFNQQQLTLPQRGFN